MGQRFATGLRLVSASWEVLRTDRQLMIFPLAAFGATAVAATPLAFGLRGISWDQRPSPSQWLGIAVFYFVANFIAIYFNAALIAAATIRLTGGTPTLRDGFRAANSRLGRIAAWALVGVGVNLVFEQIESRLGPLGRLVTWLLGFVWDTATFLVVPVLVFEDTSGPLRAMRRSVLMFRRQWGEQLIGDGVIELIFGACAVPLLLVAVIVGVAWSVLAGIVVGGLIVLALIAAGGAMTAIFTAALYQHATTGADSGRFTSELMRGAFRQRRWRSRFAER